MFTVGEIRHDPTDLRQVSGSGIFIELVHPDQMGHQPWIVFEIAEIQAADSRYYAVAGPASRRNISQLTCVFLEAQP